MAAYEYKMVQVPPNISIEAKKMFAKAPPTTRVAADYLHAIVTREATDGWEFLRVDTIGVVSSPGCLAGLLGASAQTHDYYVISFRR